MPSNVCGADHYIYRAARSAIQTTYAATYAEYAVANAADAIWLSGGDKQEALADMADIVRKRLYIGKVEL
jgi:hypothetical protein